MGERDQKKDNKRVKLDESAHQQHSPQQQQPLEEGHLAGRLSSLNNYQFSPPHSYYSYSPPVAYGWGSHSVLQASQSNIAIPQRHAPLDQGVHQAASYHGNRQNATQDRNMFRRPGHHGHTWHMCYDNPKGSNYRPNQQQGRGSIPTGAADAPFHVPSEFDSYAAST